MKGEVCKKHTKKKMEDLNEDEVFEKKEPKKINLKFLKNKKVITSIICVLVVVLIIVLGYFEYQKGIISGLFNKSTGNTIGNIYNSGYIVGKGDYIYYVSPDDKMNNTNIYKTKNGTTEREIIYNGNYDIRSLNIRGNKIYFISLSTEEVQENEYVDNKIYSMNLDGSDLKVINDNEFSEEYYGLYIVGNKIFYVGEDYNIYKMNLDGSNRELAYESKSGVLGITNDYIICNKESKDEEGNENYITYIVNIKTGEERSINGSMVYTPDIYGDYIYYINQEEKFVKSPITGGDEEIIFEYPIFNPNIYNGVIYYMNYKDEANEDYTVCIYKYDLAGGEPEIIKEFEYYSTFIDIANNNMYYMDMNEEKAFINLINLSDSSELTLHEWKYDELNEDNQENVEAEKSDEQSNTESEDNAKAEENSSSESVTE